MQSFSLSHVVFNVVFISDLSFILKLCGFDAPKDESRKKLLVKQVIMVPLNEGEFELHRINNRCLSF